MTRSAATLAALALAATACPPAAAQYTFQFAAGGTFSTALTVDAGAKVSVQVYLTDTGTTLATKGVNAVGVQLTSSAASVARVQATADIAPNSAFTGPPARIVDTAAGTSFVQDSLLGTGPPYPTVAVDTSTTPNRILVGTFDFTGLTTGVTTLGFADGFPTSTNIRLGDGTVLDTTPGLYSQVATVTVVPVPEPAGLTAATAVLLAASLAVRRRAAVK